MNKISIIFFSKQGEDLAKKIKTLLTDRNVNILKKPEKGFKKVIEKQFENGNAIVFIGACGIAVRLIAPFVNDKLSDPPVIVIDDKGQHVIPILSGHYGGANELARLISEKLKAEAVITTATDIYGKFAVDVFAKRNGLKIMNKEGIAVASGKILKGEKASVVISLTKPKGINKNEVLWLRPKLYVLGIGCKKGKPYKEISKAVSKALKKNKINISDIYAIASIDIKKDEKGINKWSGKNRVPFLTFSKDELMCVEGSFSGSDFVKNTVGIDNVCERAAICASNGSGELILNKQAENGITLAIAKRRLDLNDDFNLPEEIICMEKM